VNYQEFIKNKAVVDEPSGLLEVPNLNKSLFDFQRDIVSWALRRGRAAVFADCGMGKTIMQLEWGKNVPGNVLILAPLAVSSQTVKEAHKFGIAAKYARKQEDATEKITVTNYEMLEHFDPEAFNGIILDESSILKAYDGKTRTAIIDAFKRTPYRLACTATPAPNDYMELGNHSEFLGVMNREEMLSMFFVHDGAETQKWRIKGHAETVFWKWLSSWAVMIRKPSDLGYNDGNFILPELRFHEMTVSASKANEGFLIPMPAASLQERISARRNTINERVSKAAELVKEIKGPWVIWCNLNGESQEITKSIRGAVEVTGSQPLEEKEKRLTGFSDGTIKTLVTKPLIAGHGMNWQHASKVAFVGLSDSYEQFYQAVRRCWRFGQKKPVDVYLITADTEGAILENIKRKEKEAEKMAEAMVEHMKDLNKQALQGATRRDIPTYTRDVKTGKDWTLHLSDCVEVAQEMKSDSIHFSVYSPPFASLYTYSNSERDMGNCKNNQMFLDQYRFLVRELLRVTMPGRLTSFHCMNLPSSKTRDGFIGVKDFRGQLIKIHEDEGWIYHSEVCIWKDPVIAMQRTKALGLLHKQIKKDSCMSRQGIADYLVTMRKPGENPERVTHTNESFPVQVWQQYASPVWMDIDPGDTLQHRSAREFNDERHICPLQLEIIRRALRLWSNPGDLVFSPFAGIASEGTVSLEMGRKFVGAELKQSYFNQAVSNLSNAQMGSVELFKDMASSER
jgi:superfamily II DNA or RNA helicase